MTTLPHTDAVECELHQGWLTVWFNQPERRNPLTDEVALGIARGLGGDKSLEMINLQNCRLTDKGLLALASAAEGAETLAHIKLWGNHFGQESGAAWAKVLEAKGMKSDFTTYVVDGTVHVAAC